MTQELKHTPAPWKFNFESVDPEWAVVTTNGGSVIANVNSCGLQESNARLIAAAPELLEALENALGLIEMLIDDKTRFNYFKVVCDGKAAIAKAKGQS